MSFVTSRAFSYMPQLSPLNYRMIYPRETGILYAENQRITAAPVSNRSDDTEEGNP